MLILRLTLILKFLLILSCQKREESLQTLLLPELNLNSIKQIQISSREQSVTIEKRDDQWYVISPIQAKAFGPGVTSALFALVDLPRGNNVAYSEETINSLGLKDDDEESDLVKIILEVQGRVKPFVVSLGSGKEVFDNSAKKMLGKDFTNRRYVRVEPYKTISLVNYPFNEFSSHYLDWVDFSLPTYPERIKKVHLNEEGNKITFSRNGPYRAFLSEKDQQKLSRGKQMALSNLLHHGEFYAPLEKEDVLSLLGDVKKFEVEDFHGRYYLFEVGGSKIFNNVSREGGGDMGFTQEKASGPIWCKAIRLHCFESEKKFLNNERLSMHEFFLSSSEVEPILELNTLAKK